MAGRLHLSDELLAEPIMQPTAITLTLNDIVFADRNRAYGAYVLRQGYRSTLTRAFVLTIGLFLLALIAPALYARFHPTDNRPSERMIEATLENQKLEKATPPVVPLAEPQPPVVTVKSLPPVVIPEADIVTDEVPPTVEELQKATTGEKMQAGSEEGLSIIQPPETTAPTATERGLEVKPSEEPSEILVIEQQPEFPGGMSALQDFLGRNLRYPPTASRSGISGRVFLSFVVGADGRISEVAVLKGIGFGCDEEAVRVMRAMPAWKPGKQSSRAVRVRYNLPISFALE